MDILYRQVRIQEDLLLSGGTPELHVRQVHLWWADLSRHQSLANKFMSIVNDDERQRAAAFRHERHRKNFCIRQGILRTLLAGYLAVPPQAVLFNKTEFGKPFLADNDKMIRFNLSHSAGYALTAVRRNAEVGVDIEKIRPLEDQGSLAERILSTAELKQFGELPQTQQRLRFLQIWVRKEAYLKARGYGLQIEPQSITILPEAGGFVEARVVYQDGHLEQGWRVFDLNAPLGYVAALCFQE